MKHEKENGVLHVDVATKSKEPPLTKLHVPARAIGGCMLCMNLKSILFPLDNRPLRAFMPRYHLVLFAPKS